MHAVLNKSGLAIWSLLTTKSTDGTKLNQQNYLYERNNILLSTAVIEMTSSYLFKRSSLKHIRPVNKNIIIFINRLHYKQMNKLINNMIKATFIERWLIILCERWFWLSHTKSFNIYNIYMLTAHSNSKWWLYVKTRFICF